MQGMDVIYLLLDPLEVKRAFADIQGKVNLDPTQELRVYFVHLRLVSVIDEFSEQLLLRERRYLPPNAAVEHVVKGLCRHGISSLKVATILARTEKLTT